MVVIIVAMIFISAFFINYFFVKSYLSNKPKQYTLTFLKTLYIFTNLPILRFCRYLFFVFCIQVHGEVPKTSCQICSIGTYVSGAGAIACLNCTAGKITEMEGSNRCSNCSPGLYQSEKGKAECKDCPKGYARGRHVNVGSSCSKVKTI